VQSLDAIGFIAGPRVRAGSPRVVIEEDTPRDRPLEPLPGFALRCDGRGGCCRIYATVLMTRAEVERARTLLPEHRVGPVTHARFFLPVAGSEPSEVFTPTTNDGACGYLERDGGCAIHRVGGLLAKPAGCATFPRLFVDDGTTVRVSVRTECACVLDSGANPGDESLLDPRYAMLGDLPPHVVVTRLPARVPIDRGVEIDRREARAWIDAWRERPIPADPAAGLWAMADAIGRDGLAAALAVWSDPPAPSVAAIAPWITALHARAHARAREDATWRSDRDDVRDMTAWLSSTLLLLRAPDVLAELVAAPPEDPAEEIVHLQASAFAYAWFDRPLALSLRDHAVRIWTARAMPSLVPPAAIDAPGGRRPLARVNAILRAYGIGNYVEDLGMHR
jgi:lysine-N-methylase